MKRLQSISIILFCFICALGCVKTTVEPLAQSDSVQTAAPEISVDEISFESTETQKPRPEAENPIPTATVPAADARPTAEIPATPIPTQDTSAAPTEYPQTYAAQDGEYTIAWMSDPQHYSKKFPETYYAMTGFLRDHREEMNLAYIINTGDLVHNTDLSTEWDVADRAQAMIDEIPNGVLAGNHDVLDPIGYKTFCARFGEKRYQNRPWYGGSFENNRGHYDLLTIGETDYLFVYMGFAPSQKIPLTEARVLEMVSETSE